MKKRWVAIVDQDTEYAKRLADYLNGKNLRGVFAVAFSTQEQWQQYENKAEFQEILVGEGVAFLEGNLQAECRCRYLRETREEGGIYKYQAGEKLLAEILPEEMPQILVERAQCKFIGVYSPVRRCLKTSLALALGQYFGEKGKTLVISLDMFSGLLELLGKPGFDLSEVLYYWKQKEEWEEFFYQAVVPVKDMEVLLPIWNPLDIPVLSSGEFCRFLSDVMRLGRYETLILDVGEARENFPELLEAMEHIYMPIGWDSVDKSKLSDYQRFLNARGLESVLEKTEYITFPALEELHTCENYVEELLWGRFYSFVRQRVMAL